MRFEEFLDLPRGGGIVEAALQARRLQVGVERVVAQGLAVAGGWHRHPVFRLFQGRDEFAPGRRMRIGVRLAGGRLQRDDSEANGDGEQGKQSVHRRSLACNASQRVNAATN